jgi:hypothetical protein
LLPLVAVEEYIDLNPWDGLRFGILNPPAEGEFRGAIWNGQTYAVTVGSKRTALLRDRHLRFEADAGVVVREYEATPSRLSFYIICERAVRITSMELASGDYSLKLMGRGANTVKARDGRLTFDVPAGEHHVSLGQ